MDEHNTFGAVVRAEEMENRLAKLEKIKAEGRDPFGRRFERTHQNQEIVEGFDALEGQAVTIAGRLMTKRGHGKAAFANLSDRSGEMQIYAKDVLGEEFYQRFVDLTWGPDRVTAPSSDQPGRLPFRLKRELLPALRPLSEKWHGLKDVDIRYRQRYLDLISNPEAGARRNGPGLSRRSAGIWMSEASLRWKRRSLA